MAYQFIFPIVQLCLSFLSYLIINILDHRSHSIGKVIREIWGHQVRILNVWQAEWNALSNRGDCSPGLVKFMGLWQWRDWSSRSPNYVWVFLSSRKPIYTKLEMIIHIFIELGLRIGSDNELLNWLSEFNGSGLL